ncbi:NAD-dependent epimerase/dehydratase family protein [Sphingobacterium sp. LRF_L2]|uniref:NAD-dependent epimerase/dehydratase family protein n=1 Tax=Sphingobacterium sp. LRF_L2 TaxID=3369421 RepID=UPI003F60950A
MKKKILVTGASGFVGTHLVEAASLAGFEVHAIVRKSSIVDGILPFTAKLLYPDLTDTEGLKKIFAEEKYDYVIHAAALTKAKSEAQLFAVNVDVTKCLIASAFDSTHPPSRFVFVSSLAAIGPVNYNADAISETSPYHPVTAYGRSKRAAEEMILAQFSDKPISIIRPTAVYGPREKDLFILFDTMNKGLDVYIGKTPQKLSFIHVSDLVTLLINACSITNQGVQIFNVTDGYVYPRYVLADIFRKTFAKRMLRFHIPYVFVEKAAYFSQWLYRNSPKTPVLYPERLGELTAQNWACDISKARRVLNFKPIYKLEDGLKESLEWYQKNKWF